MNLKSLHRLASQVADMSTLVRNLPGRVSCQSEYSNESDCHLVHITGYDIETDAEAYECRVAFSFGDKESRIKNFSIHDPAQRGQGLGAQFIANLVETTRGHTELEQISLTAELERGALVWLKMGWLPDQTSFTKLQKKCLPKLDALQQLLPESERLAPTAYGIFRDLLDHESTTDAAYAWVIADTAKSYNVTPLKEIQAIANIDNQAERRSALADRVKANGFDLTPDQVQKMDKALVFIRALDLDNLAREGKIKVSAALLAWESWKGTLRMDNPLQMERLALTLNKVTPDVVPLHTPHSAQDGIASVQDRELNA